MEKQAHYIQALLVDKLERCRDKENKQVEAHIKEIQEVYQESPQETHQPMNINKGNRRKALFKMKKCFYINSTTYLQKKVNKKHQD